MKYINVLKQISCMVSMFIIGMMAHANEDNRLFLAVIAVTIVGYSFVKEK